MSSRLACHRAVVAAIVVFVSAACRKSAPPTPTPAIVAEKAPASSSASPSASASTAPAKLDHCALVDPDGSVVRDKASSLPSVVAGPGGVFHASAVIEGEGALELDLDATGVVTPKKVHAGGAGGLQSTSTAFAIDGGPGRFVLFGRPQVAPATSNASGNDTDLVLSLETPKRTLERSTWKNDQYADVVYLPSRIAAATDGAGRFYAVTMGHEVNCPNPCMADWPARVCTCPVLGLPRDSPAAHTTDMSMDGVDDVRAWFVDEGGKLAGTDGIDFPDEDGIDAIAMAGDEKGAYFVYKKTGGIYVSPIAWDDPKSAAPGKAVAGGDLGAPSAAIAGDTVWLTWPQRPTPGKKDPRTLYTVGYRRAEGKAGMPKRLLPTLTGTTTAPTLMRDGDGVALAWMQVENKRTRLYLGRGATPELAAQAAAVLGEFAGEGVALAFAMAGKTGAILWSTSTRTLATRIECP